MAKQLNIDLNFNADTSKAKQNLQDLQKTLKEIGSFKITSSDSDLKKAVESAKSLEKHLQSAFNQKTGNIDLLKFEKSLKNSNQSISGLSNSLLNAGVTGEKAFLQLQSSISSANVKLIQSKSLLGDFFTTLKNTARWQISSSVLHGFMGAMQNAYSYAQNLNESLNNIRIVTGKSSSQMKDFAVQANNAAKNLSTTTTRYTNASLIYYQQGLDENEVRQRTEVTMKMANAAGESAQVVSDQMTAVWNNFDDGSKSLEYYADVMTALGAATASSTSEISEGLSKFAAIADTVGLSYEYATSALATVTSTTRQSADVVGTAFKTMFARIQGLNLGETLEDGTTLNKYSEALMSVGISIKDGNGNLKDMDNILDEMANKWQTLRKDEQVALAQTVAGTRQYTQLVALMDNWDFMEENLETARNSEGTLSAQAAIFEESWEAASNRVRASLEDAYKDLVPEDTFISLLNGFSGIIDIVDLLVESLGGLKGIILLVGSVALQKMAPEFGSAIQQSFDKVNNLFSRKKKKMQSPFTYIAKGEELDDNQRRAFSKSNLQDENQKNLELRARDSISEDHYDNYTDSFRAQISSLQTINSLTQQINNNEKLLTSEVKEQLAAQIEQVQVLGEKEAAALDEQRSLKTEEELLDNDIFADLYPRSGQTSVQIREKYANIFNGNKDDELGWILGEEEKGNLGSYWDGQLELRSTQVHDLGLQAAGSLKSIKALQVEILELKNNSEDSEEALKKLWDEFGGDEDLNENAKRKLAKKYGISKELVEEIRKSMLDERGQITGDAAQGFKNIISTLQKGEGVAKQFMRAIGVPEKHIQKASELGNTIAESMIKAKKAHQDYVNGVQSTSQQIAQAIKNAQSFGSSIARGLSNISNFVTAFSSIQNSLNVFQNADSSFFEKTGAGLTALITSFRVLTGVLGQYNNMRSIMNGTQGLANTLTSAGIVLSKEKTASQAKEMIGAKLKEQIQEGINKKDQDNHKIELEKFLTQQLGIEKNQAEALSNTLVAGSIKVKEKNLKDYDNAQLVDIALKKAGAKANGVLAGSFWALHPAITAVTGALGILIAGLAVWYMHQQQVQKAQSELAERQAETVKANQEEEKANGKLITSYEEAVVAFREGKIEQEELRDKALALAEAYGEQSDRVLALKGDYDALTKSIREKRIAELEGNQEDTSNAARNTAVDMINKLRKGAGKASSGEYLYSSKNLDSFSNSESIGVINDIFSKNNYKYFEKINNSNNNGTSSSIEGKINNIYNPEAVLGYYEELRNIISEYEKNYDGDLASDEFYQGLIEEQKQGEADYKILKDLVSSGKNELLESNILKTENEINVTDLDEYNKFVDSFIQGFLKDSSVEDDEAKDWETSSDEKVQQLVEQAKTYLRSTSKYKNYALESEGLQGLEKEVADYYKELDDNEKEIFWTLNLKGAELDDIKAAMEQAQNYLNQNHLNVEIDLGKGLIDKLSKKKLTDKDWAEVEELYKGLYDDTLKKDPNSSMAAWDDFSIWSKEKQLEYIQQMTSGNQEEAYESATKTLEGMDTKKKNLEDEIARLKEEANEARWGSEDGTVPGAEKAKTDAKIARDNADSLSWFDPEKTAANDTADDAETAAKDAEENAKKVEAELAAKEAELERLKQQEQEAVRTLDEADENAVTGAKAFGIDEERFRKYRDYLVGLNEDLKNDKKALNELALANLRFEKGMENLSKNWKDWSKSIDEADENSEEYAHALKEATKETENILNLDAGSLSEDFLENTKNAELLEKAINGDKEAFNELQVIASTNQLLEDSGLKELPYELSQIINDVANIEGINIGDIITLEDNAGLASELNLLYTQAYNTVLEGTNNVAAAMEAGNRAINAVGFEVPEMEMEAQEITVTGQLPTSWEATEGNEIVTTGPDGEKIPVKGAKIIKKDNGTYTYTYTAFKPKNGKGFTKTSEHVGGGASKSGGGGGGGGKDKKPKTTKVSKASDVLDRYKEIDDALDDNKEKLDDIADITDRLYGANKLKAMQRHNEIIENEIRLNKEKKKQAEAYLAIDKKNLEIAAKGAGVTLELDKNGNISNYTKAMEGLFTELRNAQLDANADGDATEEEEEKIKNIQERIDFLKDAISQYDETKELMEDLDNEIQEQLNEWQDNNAEMLAYKVEVNIELNDKELELVEYYMDKIADDFYKMAENSALLASKGPTFRENLKIQKDYYNSLTEAFKNEAISQDAYVEGLKDCQDAILDNLSSLNDLDKEMLEYYGETLAAAGEELAKYTSQMEHQTSVLEHYSSIMDLLGKSTDYDKMGAILEGQGQVIKNELDIAKEAYQHSLDEVNKWKEKMDAAVSDPAAYEVYKKNWETAVEATQEAQETMLSKTEAYIEQMKAILENSLNKANKEFEKKLTNGIGFDKMNTDLEHAQNLQEDYLTTTNKIFETNKLMQKAQNDLDTTNNKLAKDKLKHFMDETKQLQEKGKLSKFELDIQKAKYDLLVAEMALEDAKDAKSQVRLERDSEGNFSYVYTADEDKLNEAQSKFEQAQNDLYNISLEGANKYSEKYQQTLNDFYTAMTELQQRWLEGEFESQEEYDKAVADTQAYYYEQLGNYSNLYQIGLQTDACIVDGIWQGSQDLMTQAHDIWITDADGMTHASEEWKNNISAHLSEVKGAFNSWKEDLEKVKIDANTSLEEISKEVNKVVGNSNDLAEKTKNEVIPAIQTEIDKVGELSDKFASTRKNLMDLINEYERLVKSVNQAINFQATVPNVNDLPVPDTDQVFDIPDQDVHINIPVYTPSYGGGGLSDGSGGGNGNNTSSPTSPNGTPGDYLFEHGIGGGLGNTSVGSDLYEDRKNFYETHGIYAPFDTGGYTGNWGPEGKLAILHEKEQVLNKNDTSNLFKTIELTQQILKVIDLNANQASFGFGLLNSPSLRDTSNQVLEQEVTIHAEFPNVNNHNEIEEAFNNLVNQASQFANRKKNLI